MHWDCRSPQTNALITSCSGNMCCKCSALEQVVTDTVNYPSPVIALASQHTVNQAFLNRDGTVIQLRKWNRILGLEDRCQHRLCRQYGSLTNLMLCMHATDADLLLSQVCSAVLC